MRKQQFLAGKATCPPARLGLGKALISDDCGRPGPVLKENFYLDPVLACRVIKPVVGC